MKDFDVYVLDDTEEILELISDILLAINIKAKVFSEPEKLFGSINSFNEDSVLILDLKMPKIDGVEVIRMLSEKEHAPKLILISGQDRSVMLSAERLAKERDLDIITSFSKPFSVKEFQLFFDQYSLYKLNKTKREKNEVTADIEFQDFKNALEANQLVLHFQPQIDLKTGSIVGFEALTRWQHPQKGLLYPDTFIHLVEKNNYMNELTYWMINEIIQKEKMFIDAGLNHTISANISADNITSLTLPEKLLNLLKENNFEPSKLNFEITESALMKELITSLDILTRLRLKGIGLSIDDFGTGYSSFVQLHRIPFNELKIDKSFVMKMLNDNVALAIVKTCINLGHDLNMRVVAEGVETKKHNEKLKELGCDIGQGYYFSKPKPIKLLIEKYGDNREPLAS